MADDLFSALFSAAELESAVAGEAWIRAIVRAETALAVAESAHGVIPEDAARAISDSAGTFLAETGEIGRAGRDVGNPSAGVVVAFTAHVAAKSPEAAKYVHLGATSQDIMDTAAMLVTKDALAVIAADVLAVIEILAGLTADHRTTIMIGRTLVQHALPTTFGVKAAVWLTAMVTAAEELERIRHGRLAAQLGGAVGTLASLGDTGTAVTTAFAAELALNDPVIPWHTDRTRIAQIGNALALVAGVANKIALDVILMAQTEVGELAERRSGESGSSSTMPHKRNPIAAVLARGSALRVPGLSMTLQAAMAQEHERAAGAWHSEWQTLCDILLATGGAVGNLRRSLTGIEVDTERMRANLELSGGQMMTESVNTRLTGTIGRIQAHHLMSLAATRAAQNGTSLRDELLDDPLVLESLSADEIDQLLDPASYLGSADVIVSRALLGSEAFLSRES